MMMSLVRPGEYLARREIELEIRHHGKLGLEAAFSGQYDLVLLDVTLSWDRRFRGAATAA
jgi:hypothetical protein